MSKDLYSRLGVQQPPPPTPTDPPPPTPEPQDDPVDPPAPPAPPTPPEPQGETDEELLARLQRINPNIQSLEDIRGLGVKQESEEVKQKKKKNEVLAFALRNELITRDEYDQYQLESAKPPRQVVYEDYAARRAAQGASPEKIEREFQKLWHEDVELEEGTDDDDLPVVQQRKEEMEVVVQQRKEEMEAAARRIIRKKYAKVIEIERKYDDHVAEATTQKQREQEVLQTFQTYKNDLDAISASVKPLTIPVGDKESNDVEDVVFEYPADVVNQVKTEFLQRDVALQHVHNYDKGTLETAFMLRLNMLTEPARLNYVSKAYHSKRLKNISVNRKNLVPDAIPGGGSAPARNNEMLRQRVRGFIAEDPES